MSIRRAAILLAVTFQLAGCVGSGPLTPQGEVPTAQDAGFSPFDTSKVIDDFLRFQLKDSESARIEAVSAPVFRVVPQSSMGPAFYGWVLCFKVNAKNSFGGYAGFRQAFVVTHSHKVVGGEIERGDGGLHDSTLQSFCRVIEAH